MSNRDISCGKLINPHFAGVIVFISITLFMLLNIYSILNLHLTLFYLLYFICYLQCWYGVWLKQLLEIPEEYRYIGGSLLKKVKIKRDVIVYYATVSNHKGNSKLI
jgi:hypothetical protein